MAETILRHWPVPTEPSRHPKVELSLAGPASRFVLRTRCADALPTRMLMAAPLGGGHALQLGPDEWLVILPEGEAPPPVDGAHSLVDVSDRNVAFEVEGTGAASLIQTGCPLDLHRFPCTKATRTLFEGVEIVVWRTGEEAFRIEVWRSFAAWLWAALDLAAGDLT